MCPALPIPKALHCFETGAPFEHCLLSGKPLAEDHTPYIIQKIFHGEEVILELAVRLEQAEGLNEGVSANSRDRINEHIWEQIDFHKRYQELLGQAEVPDFDRWTERCIFNGKERAKCSQYTLTGLCQGNLLLFLPDSPVMVSDDCNEYVQRLLSEETRRFMNDFIGQHFPTPPEFADLPGAPSFLF